MGKFAIFIGIGNIAARRDIEIMNSQAAAFIAQFRGNVTGIGIVAEKQVMGGTDRQARHDRHTVIALLTIDHHVFITELAEIR